MNVTPEQIRMWAIEQIINHSEVTTDEVVNRATKLVAFVEGTTK